MEYAVANKWLFSSSGTWVHRLACGYHLIAHTISGQYHEGESVMSSRLCLWCLTCHIPGLGCS
jgi:hypothetical protein